MQDGDHYLFFYQSFNEVVIDIVTDDFTKANEESLTDDFTKANEERAQAKYGLHVLEEKQALQSKFMLSMYSLWQTTPGWKISVWTWFEH